MLRDFHENVEIGIYIQKARQFALRDVFIEKSRHFEKSKTICVTFLCTKILTICVTQFLAEGGGLFLFKNNAICVTFIFAKNNTLSVTL